MQCYDQMKQKLKNYAFFPKFIMYFSFCNYEEEN